MAKERFPFAEIEQKWQQQWKKSKLYQVDLDKIPEKKQYTLVMFSYPSASKLHIGHWWNYGPTDTYSRFLRMRGCTVFEPMGFDSFGLPAENYAIKIDSHPKTVTENSIASIEKQLEAIGAMYDWSHKVVTSRPNYYKWTQWLFLQLYKRNLAYQKEGLVNWCTSCQTVLANEQVSPEGECERCGSSVIQKKMKQWYFRITEYADKLLTGLDKLEWPESTIKRQKNWIGRSEGARIVFPLESGDENIEVFTTRPDTLFGVTYVVLAPENDLVARLTKEEHRKEVDEYIQRALHATEVERTAATREKTGVFTGSYALHPLTGKKLPIWIADYVLGSYGTGAVMAVPAHDQRDFEFALAHSLPIRVVIRPKDGILDVEDMMEAYEGPGIMVNSGDFAGLKNEDGMRVIAKKLAELNLGGPSVTYRIRDWSISRQRYWGAPIPIIHCEQCGTMPVPEKDLPVLLPDEIKDFRPKGTSPLGNVTEWIETTCPKCGAKARRDPDTMDTFVDSSFYHLRYLSANENDKPFNLERMKNWLPIDMYVGGSDHATGHLIYFRFITRFLHDIGWCPVEEPAQKLIHQGTIKHHGIKMSKSRGNVVNPDEFVEKYGSDVFRMYLMFMGDYTEGGDWSDEGITGIDRFLNRIWRLVLRFGESHTGNDSFDEKRIPGEVNRTLHHTIREVTRNLESFSFNTAISRMMELVNGIYTWVGDENSKIDSEAVNFVLLRLIRLAAPFAPHFSEECWSKMNGVDSIFNQAWPDYDENALVRKTFTLVVQINGKVREKTEAPADADRNALADIAKKLPRIREFLDHGTLRKEIVVPGKLVNLVIQ